MKWVAFLLVPGIGIVAAFQRLLQAVSVSVDLAVASGDFGLLAASTTSLTAGVLMASVGMLLVVFLFNAALALAYPTR